MNFLCFIFIEAYGVLRIQTEGAEGKKNPALIGASCCTSVAWPSCQPIFVTNLWNAAKNVWLTVWYDLICFDMFSTFYINDKYKGKSNLDWTYHFVKKMVRYTYTDVVKGREPSLRLGLARNRYCSGWFSVKQWYWYGNGTIFARRIEWILLEDAKLQKPNCTRPVSHGSVLKGSVFQSQWVWHSSLPFGPCLPFPGPQDSSSGSLSQILRMAKGRCFSHGFLVLWPSLKTQPRCEWWVQNHTGHGWRHRVTGNPLQPQLRQEMLIFPASVRWR